MFGWNACSSALCPLCAASACRTSLPGGARPALVAHSYYRHKPNPRKPKIVKVIEPQEVLRAAQLLASRTRIHVRPRKAFTLARWVRPTETARRYFHARLRNISSAGPREVNRGPQFLHYDFWWHLGFDTLLTSEWGTPNMIENGLQPDLLLGSKYGHQMHVWDLRRRRHLQALDLA